MSLDALEVGVSFPRRATEQTSHDTAQQALAAMRRDQYFYAAQEQQHAKERRDSRLMEPATVRKPLPPKRKKKNIVAATRDSKPALQSHAATHPSLYHQPPTEADARMPFPQLPMKPVDVGLDHAHQKSQSLVKRWQTYSDPKASTSAAMCDDPRFRLLEIDVDPEEPNVISPGWMVALPFGTLVEAACEYLEGTESD
jgi:hypothetical protein